jgi:SsrA-binding protein
VGRDGMTIVPIKMYFNDKGRVKLQLGVAKGKKLADKRETSAKRDWERQKSRIMKQGAKGM